MIDTDTLQTEWEETEEGIRADITTTEKRIHTEVTFHDDGSVSEVVTVHDTETNEVMTDETTYDWEVVQRGFLKEIMRDLTDRAGGSRRVRLTGPEASAITLSAERVVENHTSQLKSEAIEDIERGCERIRQAFEEMPMPRVDNGVKQPQDDEMSNERTGEPDDE